MKKFFLLLAICVCTINVANAITIKNDLPYEEYSRRYTVMFDIYTIPNGANCLMNGRHWLDNIRAGTTIENVKVECEQGQSEVVVRWVSSVTPVSKGIECFRGTIEEFLKNKNRVFVAYKDSHLDLLCRSE